jgi:hypothetical protein
VLFPFLNDPFVEAIAKRSRGVVARQPAPSLDAVAAALSLPPDALRRFMNAQDRRIDTVFLIDIVAALVHECGIDPKWLLAGDYDGEMHRKALLLGEDRGSRGVRAVRDFVQREYRQLRQARHSFPLSMPWVSSVDE